VSGRLDTDLVRRGLARSRGQARELVEAGLVTVSGTVVRKQSYAVPDGAVLEVRDAGPTWVSRAAAKLDGAFVTFGPSGLSASGRRCADVGASTGGFTQVLLHEGAAHVVAIDVGHGQLVRDLAEDPRVTELIGVTVRGLTADRIGGPVDLLVADLSFISLSLVLAEIAALMAVEADAVVLVKPQFEVGRERLGKNGLVRRAADRAWAITEVTRVAIDNGLTPLGLARSPLAGSTGNLEYLLWLTRRTEAGMGWEAVVATADRLSLDGAP
jgi:23S rRNA (cytidine1920-2'-O)/16S rRNA (cytidine1409-2'-O)-methyltransferase